MEHKIVLGGEQFLPFARSRIRALRALGLPYADQSFEIDGVSIKVRIEPGHEYIRIEGTGTAYMESGQLEGFGTGELNTTRLEPSKWRFLDVPTDGKYLGKISTSGKNVGKQNNSPTLSEGMDSLAIGYPKALAADPEKAAKDAQTQADYEGLTLLRKTVIDYFPASLFTGKMRLFMQAQYGAAESIKFNPLIVDIVGTQVVLKYSGRKGEVIQFGFWSHNTPFIFTDEKGRYWLMLMTNPTGGKFILTVYPISAKYGMFSGAKDTTDPEEIRQREAYVMSTAIIETDKPEVIGEFEDESGGAIAYGWKANSTGSEVGIVLNKTIGTDSLDNKWFSTTVKCSILCKINDKGERAFTATFLKKANGFWQDGWGQFNIFRPGDTSLYLESYSILMDRLGAAPEFSFPATEVYGYYKDESWVSVTISRDMSTTAKYKEACSMAYPATNYNPATRNRFQYDAILATDNWNYSSSDISSSVTMDLTVGVVTYAGVSEYGQHIKVERVCSPPVNEGPASMANYISATTNSTSGLFFSPPEVYGNPPGYDAWVAKPPETPLEASHFFGGYSDWTTEHWVYTGKKSHKWTLVIPCSDCEAVFVGTHEADQPDTTGTHTVEVDHRVLTVQNHDSGYSVTAYTGYSVANAFTESTSDTDPLPPSTAEIYCFTSVLSGAEGTYHASSVPLFEVDKDYAYYMANMYSFTSSGGRYVISEGLKLPESVDNYDRFVGWA